MLDTSSHGHILPFRQAIIAVGRAVRRKWGKHAELPLLSHALPSHDGYRWHVADIGGQPVALVDSAGRAILADELIEDENNHGSL